MDLVFFLLHIINGNVSHVFTTLFLAFYQKLHKSVMSYLPGSHVCLNFLSLLKSHLPRLLIFILESILLLF